MMKVLALLILLSSLLGCGGGEDKTVTPPEPVKTFAQELDELVNKTKYVNNEFVTE